MQEINSLIQPAVAALSCELWGCKPVSQAGRRVLRVYIEKAQQGGVTLTDCAEVTHQIYASPDVSARLAHFDAIEVSSPGLDREFFSSEQCARYVGSQMRVKLYKKNDQGQRRFMGILMSVQEEQLLLDTELGKCCLRFADLESIHLVPAFDSGAARRLPASGGPSVDLDCRSARE